MEGKCYQDLEKAVWDAGICAGCGACVAVCPADAIYFRTGADSAHPVHCGYCKQATDDVPCGACYEVCPRASPVPATEQPPGDCIDWLTARAAFEVPGRQSGGAVTAILHNALEEGLIDAVVTVAEDRWTHRPSSVVITETDALIHQAGSRYAWWVPLVAALKEAVMIRKHRRIAVVGVPCVAAALARMRRSEHPLLRPFTRSIRLVIGLFCTESFDFHRLMEEKLGREHRIEPWQIRRLDVKGKLIVGLTDGRAIEIPLTRLEECVRPGCHACTDLTAREADISAGGIGSKEGCTTLILRTELGKGFVDDAVRTGRLIVSPEVDKDAIERLAAQKRNRRS
ncbi:MAG: Coenzyme F420 hydrogenase/dehydrogenase, beta subunit C-terminal domain [Methanomicrobiales archaeon]|nr:Coenzyme F420 hydrogenase/dehydrogenase, beta subunit C-terminal domain [Methanomicrobiales archaeon]MDI6875200.1 Coenzyme F420 hydrogenase/dehydrogenase, beta subunit C-terminal domain [Methanomicrobiales archaeon]